MSTGLAHSVQVRLVRHANALPQPKVRPALVLGWVTRPIPGAARLGMAAG
jgi:hypothetical protein